MNPTHSKVSFSVILTWLFLLVALMFTVQAQADAAIDRIETIKAADKVPINAQLIAPQSLVASGQYRQTFHRPGAGFIKLHFDAFHLPPGAYVTVSNPDGTERYRYGADPEDRALFTQDETDRGATLFSPMSISGDTAIVTVHKGDAPTLSAKHAVSVDYLWQGFSDEELSRRLLAATTEQGFSTCGEMERRDVACWQNSHPTEYERSRPTARLLMSGSLCTAWRVGEQNRVFTNNHCMSTQSSVSSAEVWFNYQNTQCNGNSLANVTKVTGDTLLKTDYELDYTLFTLNGFEQVDAFGYYGLDVRIPTQGERIYIPQHGAGNPKELSIESDQNAGNLCRIDEAVTNGRGVDTDAGYLCDTTGGSSGSAVLAASSNKAIALHHFGGCPNQGVLIAEIWPQVSEHFNGIPDGDNGDGPGPDPDPDPVDDIQETDLADSQGDWQHFSLTVPEGTTRLTATISGGSGDADIYVRQGAEPTRSQYECRPYYWGNDEECVIDNPTAGEWFVSIHAYRAYSGVTLTAQSE